MRLFDRIAKRKSIFPTLAPYNVSNVDKSIVTLRKFEHLFVSNA